MIEVTFSESAVCSLKMAQHYGEGKGPGGDVGVAFLGGTPEPAEVERIRQEAIEAERRRWQNAVPLGGDPGDVLGLLGPWDYGPVAEAPDGAEYRRAIERLLAGVWPDKQPDGRIARRCEQTRANIERLRQAALAGRPLRIWVGKSANDAAGLRWLMAQLVQAGAHSEVSVVPLPPYLTGPHGQVRHCRDGGDIEPGDWGRYQSRARVLPPDYQRALADEWKTLAKENAPLRVCINGQLVSAGEDFYDPFLHRTLIRMPASFRGGELISRLLDEYPCLIGDAFLWQRIREMIRSGELEMLGSAPADTPAYACLLRKTGRGLSR